MRKVFLSYPMNGNTREECEKLREELIRQLRDDDEWVDMLDHDGPAYNEATRLWYLGEAIKVLGTCDAIIVHPRGEYSKGCKVEIKVAEEYGIPFIQTHDEDFLQVCDGNVTTCNVLMRNGICSRIALMRATPEEIRSFRGVGKKTFAHIMEIKNRL